LHDTGQNPAGSVRGVNWGQEIGDS